MGFVDFVTMLVQPPAPRHKTKDLGDRLIIRVPHRRAVPIVVILGFWSLFWSCFGLIFLISFFGSGKNISLSDSGVVLWGISEALLIYLLAWQFFGKEEIEITARSFKISRTIFGIRLPKEYLAEHIKNLDLARVSISDLTTWGRASYLWDFGVGNISFDYGARTYKFAGGIFDAEAKMIIAEIQQKYPQYKN